MRNDIAARADLSACSRRNADRRMADGPMRGTLRDRHDPDLGQAWRIRIRAEVGRARKFRPAPFASQEIRPRHRTVTACRWCRFTGARARSGGVDHRCRDVRRAGGTMCGVVQTRLPRSSHPIARGPSTRRASRRSPNLREGACSKICCSQQGNRNGHVQNGGSHGYAATRGSSTNEFGDGPLKVG